VPVLDLGETSLTDARQIVEYYERGARESGRLPAQPAESKQVFDEFFDELGVTVRAWAYTYQLPQRRSTANAWMHGVPWIERQVIRGGYPLLAVIVKRSLKLRTDALAEHRAAIDRSLARVASRLADGRRYLFADTLGAADMAFASLIAPAVLAPEYSGPLPTIDELSEPMRQEVTEIRAHPAGQFALRLFREDRHVTLG